MSSLNKKAIFLLFCIIFSCAILRIYHIGFGLPYFAHPDEGQYLNKALAMLSQFDFNPKAFNNQIEIA